MVKAVVGANWGDEGKGKFTDMLAEDADIVIRFQGGANAGHTIVNDYGKFALHTMPSGVFHQKIMNIIGNGVAFDIEKFLSRELELKEKDSYDTYEIAIDEDEYDMEPGEDAPDESKRTAADYGSLTL